MKLEVDIKKKFQGFTLEVSFKGAGETLGILGASGSGKSMTLRCIAGLETPDSGKIILNNRVLFDSEKKINLPSRQRKIGILFQNYALFPHLTVEENIGFGLRGLPKAVIKQKVTEQLAKVQLVGMEKRYPRQLSGGQQQRVALARALVVEPEAILLDEPFSALDNYLKGIMERELLDSLKDYQGPTLFVTHNLDEAYRICDNILILSEGKEVAYGDKANLFRQPPNLVTAKLTGCNNISRAQKLAENVVEATDWGCRICVNQPIPHALEYIGIHAPNLQLVNEPTLPNSYSCQVTHQRLGAFNSSIFVKLETATSFIQIDENNDLWHSMKDQETFYLYINPEKLFMISNQSLGKIQGENNQSGQGIGHRAEHLI